MVRGGSKVPCDAAALGAALFAVSDNFGLPLGGRALIGLGVAASLTAGLKALVLWFPSERIPLLNGLIIMLGPWAQRRQLCLRRSCWFRRVGEHCLRCSRLSPPDALLSSILLSQRCQHLYRRRADQIV
jgi:hypothetical protein